MVQHMECYWCGFVGHLLGTKNRCPKCGFSPLVTTNPDPCVAVT